MNEELVSRFVDSIIYRAGRAGRVVASADDPRVKLGELLTDEQARAMLTADVRRTLAGLEREMEREIRDAFVKGIRSSGRSNRPANGRIKSRTGRRTKSVNQRKTNDEKRNSKLQSASA